MPTLLAVDDSATMRKVLEITFAGTDFQVTAVGSSDAALDKVKGHAPDVVLADVSLDGKSGYDLCKAIKQAAPSTRVLILSSKHNPYDTAKGSAAQADDHMDKPFDTQQMIDRVKTLMGAPAPAAAAKPAAAAPNPAQTLPIGGGAPVKPAGQQLPSAAPLKAATPAPAAAAPPMERSRTLAYAAPVAPGAPGMPTGGAAKVAPAQPAAAPAAAAKPAAAAPAAHAPAAAPAPAAAVTLGPEMQKQLESIGLTPAQVDAVLALSREVVERVVWEVVPVLAETLIKEELARLTK